MTFGSWRFILLLHRRSRTLLATIKHKSCSERANTSLCYKKFKLSLKASGVHCVNDHRVKPLLTQRAARTTTISRRFDDPALRPSLAVIMGFAKRLRFFDFAPCARRTKNNVSASKQGMVVLDFQATECSVDLAQFDRIFCVTHNSLKRHQLAVFAPCAAHRRFDQP